MLKAALAETTEPPDAEISQAFEENQVVMYVQLQYRSLAPILFTYLSFQQRFTGRADCHFEDGYY